MSQQTQVVPSRLLKKLRYQAKVLKKEQKIQHHEALNNIARSVGFNNWEHLKQLADASAITEKALKRGLVIAMDKVDIDKYPSSNANLVLDPLVIGFVYLDMLDDNGQIPPEDKETYEDHEQNLVYFRYTGLTPRTAGKAYEITHQYFNYDPMFIYLKGKLLNKHFIFDDGKYFDGDDDEVFTF